MRYRGGTATYLDVLDCQRSLFEAEITLAQGRNNEYQSLVQLYKALGGCWINIWMNRLGFRFECHVFVRGGCLLSGFRSAECDQGYARSSTRLMLCSHIALRCNQSDAGEIWSRATPLASRRHWSASFWGVVLVYSDLGLPAAGNSGSGTRDL
jgi:Outer membrane efflux protein